MTDPYTKPAIVRRVHVRPTTRKALYIVWDDVEVEFAGLHYAGGGVTEAVLRPKPVTRRARWTSTATVHDILGALSWIHTNRPAAWMELGEP